MRVAVLTVDQVGSRGADDLVGATLSALSALSGLSGLSGLRPFERTAGDEFQGVVDDAAALPRVVELLLRAGVWSVGIGIGGVGRPLPDSVRAGRGPAYELARDAVNAAKTTPARICVRAAETEPAAALEGALWLWAALLGRRTPGGWEVADLLDAGVTHAEAARTLGITAPAVTQRARAAGIVEGRRARELTTYLTTRLLEAHP